MYVAVKGGERAIEAAHKLLAEDRRGDPKVPAVTVEQIAEQLTLAVDRVMAEGSLYDPALAALAVKQSRGDLIEAIFLIRAARTTLPRFGYSAPLDTARMAVRRRVSATFKDIPGGQILGATFDYSHRLIDFALAGNSPPERAATSSETLDTSLPRVLSLLGAEGPSRSRSRATANLAISPPHRSTFRPIGTSGCRRWRAATRASCWRSPIRRNAAMAALTPLPARFALARRRCCSRRRSSASRSPSEPSRSPNARW